MPTDAQLLIGKVLQIKDKIIAKRHCIPSDLEAEWDKLDKKTACFESEALYKSAVKGQEMNKHIDYSGSVKELSQLVSSSKLLIKKLTLLKYITKASGTSACLNFCMPKAKSRRVLLFLFKEYQCSYFTRAIAGKP